MDTMFRCNRCKRPQWGNVQKHTCGECNKSQKCSCGGLLEPMSEQEIQEENRRQRQADALAVKEAREGSKLPDWCLSAISMRAYEEGHSAGQQECDNIEIGLIHEFEEAMSKANSGCSLPETAREARCKNLGLTS